VSSGGNPIFTNNGTFNVTNFVIKGTAENYGTINAVKVSSDGNPTVTNNCSFYVKDSFSFNNGSLTMNKGILAGGVENESFLSIPTFTCSNSGIALNLNNGSMIKAGVINIPNVKINVSESGNRSLLKATTSISTGWTTGFKGKLDIECPLGEFAKGKTLGNVDYTFDPDSTKTKLYEPNKSTAIITSCSATSEVPDPTPDPTNPTYPIIVENNKEYTYTFEDQWPLYGDYDMNDVVMTIKNRQYKLNSDNKVQEFTFSINLDAVGATKSIAAAIMFDAIPASAISQAVVLGNSNLVKSFSLSNKNIENGQDYAVVPLFDNAHAALGSSKYEPINTVNGYASNTTAKNITFTMKFDTPSLTTEAFIIEKLNLFIIVEGNSSKRREIHVVKYPPTKLANTDLFGGNNDASSVSGKKYYISKDNLAWGIIVPTNYKWTLEYNNIKSVYSKFESWVKSAGTENKNWWNDFNEAKVFQTNKN
ncbi:MAG TPA: LruC domain-containing protein, partial [Bacteroides reticulotermitis]|nr:LruC domain-containing protein [Bacteroides reticulotermitis]